MSGRLGRCRRSRKWGRRLTAHCQLTWWSQGHQIGWVAEDNRDAVGRGTSGAQEEAAEHEGPGTAASLCGKHSRGSVSEDARHGVDGNHTHTYTHTHTQTNTRAHTHTHCAKWTGREDASLSGHAITSHAMVEWRSCVGFSQNLS